MVSEKQATILSLLMQAEEKYGLEMIRESNAVLKRGTIYVLLNRLEDKGLIKSRERPQKSGEQGPVRRVYRITDAGRKAYLQKVESLKAVFGIGVSHA